jgi:hypothetical protein
MRSSFGWLFQVLGLVIVGSALIFGMAYNVVRLVLAFAAGGAVLFLLGRWLQGRGVR